MEWNFKPVALRNFALRALDEAIIQGKDILCFEITWNTYSHLYPREEERAVQILNKIV